MELTLCSCGSSEHQILTEYDEEYKELHVQIHLVTYKNFFQRLFVAVKYLFGYKSRYGQWDSLILTEDNSKILFSQLEKLRSDNQEANSK